MESLVILKPGKNADGYWKNADLVEQLSKKVIPIFEILHPHAIGLFIFDNFQNHHALPPDALRASTLNLNEAVKMQNISVMASFFRTVSRPVTVW